MNNELFYLLDAYLYNCAHTMLRDPAQVESRLRDLDALHRYADVCGVSIDRDAAARMRDAGLAWVSGVSHGNGTSGEWIKYRAVARDALKNAK